VDCGAGGCRTFLRLVDLDIVKPSKASSVELSDMDMCAPERLEKSRWRLWSFQGACL
jgi:hypothetical protein